MVKRPTTEDRLKGKATAEGHEEGSPGFERRLLQLKVEKCVEGNSISTCSACPAYDECDLVKSFMRASA